MIADHERPCDPTVATLAIVTSLERVSGPSRRVKQLLPVRMLSLTDDRRSCRWRIVRQQPRHKHLTDAPTLQRPAKLPPKLRSRSRMRLIGDRGNDHRDDTARGGRCRLSIERGRGRGSPEKGAALSALFRCCSGRWSRCRRGNNPGGRMSSKGGLGVAAAVDWAAARAAPAFRGRSIRSGQAPARHRRAGLRRLGGCPPLVTSPGRRRRPTGSPPGCRCARSPARRRS